MALNKNIFYASNPSCMVDALLWMIDNSGIKLENFLIFLPSRRAVRSVERALVMRSQNNAIMLPKLVALGEGPDDEESIGGDDVFENSERVVLLAKLLSMDANIGNMTTALQIAHDFVRMNDYLENEGINPADINWGELIDDKFAQHFKSKAELLNILTSVLPKFANNRKTLTNIRNYEIRKWIDVIKKMSIDETMVVVCGSTASVPATADLMEYVASIKNGRIILSGKIVGRKEDFVLNTNPYNAEYKFLSRIKCDVSDICEIDVGKSNIDFMNYAFSNDFAKHTDVNVDVSNCHLIETESESQEALAVAEITKRAISQKKSVMVITPDSAGNQRIKSAFDDFGIVGDFSGGQSGQNTNIGRAILNLFDKWIDSGDDIFDKLYAGANYNLFDCLSEIIQRFSEYFEPKFSIFDENVSEILCSVKVLSDNLSKYDIKLNLFDARSFLADTFSSVVVRDAVIDNPNVVVLGTIEARMQTADVVILTGLNDGMFPSQGYKNSWLPSFIGQKIGLPSPDRKVSLMALDFMNLSCGKSVYWLRSKNAGGVNTTESRFLSRVIARGGIFDIKESKSILDAVNERDNVEYVPLIKMDAVCSEGDWSPVYVTELEMLIHNPYAFYCKHILDLKLIDDWWVGPDARNFGTLVHNVIEYAKNFDGETIVAQLDYEAQKILGKNTIMFYFWHKRFIEIAKLLENNSGLLMKSEPEISGMVRIDGRRVLARADRVWDGGVLDIKTGEAPNKSQLLKGNMPQLPIEALILQSGGFKGLKSTEKSKTPVMKFLQLKNSKVRVIDYDAEITQKMIDAVVSKLTELFNRYGAGNASYEYYENTEQKYKGYDDLARIE